MNRRPDGRRRRRDETGQALVEFALVIPVIVLLMGTAFNGWNAMQLSLRLTSAARAGAIVAANDLAANAAQVGPALTAATAAVNQEEATNVYQSCTSGNDCVSLAQTTQTTPSGATINVVTITIAQGSVPLVPFLGNIAVTAHATARYA